MATSPTQRSLKLMRDQGYLCEITERWNPFAKIRQDLYGFVDILCIKEGKTVAVQTTSYSNVSARIKKIQGLETYPIVKSAGWEIVIHGWKKDKAGKWMVREVFME
jgi:hypothetical protein